MSAALLVAAPASGQGKTTLTAGLARLHARQGRRVRCFKCGPDFLDPQWLALASGAPVDSLDLWINGAADCAARLAAAAAEADLVLVEGVMGLFDGQPSAADLAQRFGLPVLAVVDASAMAGTFGALVHGLKTYRPCLPWAGALANCVGGAAHAQMLREAAGADWRGHLPREAAFALPERHLGLTQVGELSDALQRLDAVADALAATPLASTLPAWQAPQTADLQALQPGLAGRRIAIARDAAHAFIYPANLSTLRELGAELVFFSPLAGDPLPDCDALWLPGGYPELHAASLASLGALAAQLQAHAAARKPLWAECGGLMMLADQLVDADGQLHRGWGLLPGRVRLQRRLAGLGAQQLHLAGEPLRGHSFHYSTFDTPLAPAAWTEPAPGARSREALYQQGSLRASYFHAWFASSPQATTALFSPCMN